MSDTNRAPTQMPRAYPAEKARQGEIILKHNWQRAVFIAGLAGGVVLVLAFALFR